MWRIKKVLNSSVVLAEDDAGVESVLLGKGIGYGRKAGDELTADAVDQVFVPRQERPGELDDVLDQVPPEYLELTHAIVTDATRRLRRELDPHLYVALTDHLHFAVQRVRKGMVVTNRLAWEMRSFYPEEYEVALDALALLRARSQVELPDEEAANIAFHLVNASRDPSFDALRAVGIIDAVMRIVTYRVPGWERARELDRSRFLTHLQYFAERVVTGAMLDRGRDFLFRELREHAPGSMEVAEQVRSHLRATEDVELPDEEVAYLGLHLQRLGPDPIIG